MQLYTEQSVDIYKLPNANAPCEKGEEISIGDLHGNSMKLLFVLFKHGIASGLNESQYKQLSDIYIKSIDPESLTQNDIAKFNQLLGQITWKTDNLLRLIGDETADRGNNDYFTLKIFETMGKNQIPFEILFSNHGLEFINAFKGDISKYSPKVGPGQAQSFQNLQTCLRKNIIPTDEVKALIDKYYTPNLKCASCAIDDKNNLSLFTHAPAGLTNIQKLSKIFEVQYSANTPQELESTIQKINEKFQETISSKQPIDLDSPLGQYVWAREHDITRPAKTNGFSIVYVHGHDSANKGQTPSNVVNLDNSLGKFSPGHQFASHNKSEYEAFINPNSRQPRVELQAVQSPVSAAPSPPSPEVPINPRPNIVPQELQSEAEILSAKKEITQYVNTELERLRKNGTYKKTDTQPVTKYHAIQHKELDDRLVEIKTQAKLEIEELNKQIKDTIQKYQNKIWTIASSTKTLKTIEAALLKIDALPDDDLTTAQKLKQQANDIGTKAGITATVARPEEISEFKNLFVRKLETDIAKIKAEEQKEQTAKENLEQLKLDLNGYFDNVDLIPITPRSTIQKHVHNLTQSACVKSEFVNFEEFKELQKVYNQLLDQKFSANKTLNEIQEEIQKLYKDINRFTETNTPPNAENFETIEADILAFEQRAEKILSDLNQANQQAQLVKIREVSPKLADIAKKNLLSFKQTFEKIKSAATQTVVMNEAGASTNIIDATNHVKSPLPNINEDLSQPAVDLGTGPKPSSSSTVAANGGSPYPAEMQKDISDSAKLSQASVDTGPASSVSPSLPPEQNTLNTGHQVQGADPLAINSQSVSAPPPDSTVDANGSPISSSQKHEVISSSDPLAPSSAPISPAKPEIELAAEQARQLEIQQITQMLQSAETGLETQIKELKKFISLDLNTITNYQDAEQLSDTFDAVKKNFDAALEKAQTANQQASEKNIQPIDLNSVTPYLELSEQKDTAILERKNVIFQAEAKLITTLHQQSIQLNQIQEQLNPQPLNPVELPEEKLKEYEQQIQSIKKTIGDANREASLAHIQLTDDQELKLADTLLSKIGQLKPQNKPKNSPAQPPSSPPPKSETPQTPAPIKTQQYAIFSQFKQNFRSQTQPLVSINLNHKELVDAIELKQGIALSVPATQHTFKFIYDGQHDVKAILTRQDAGLSDNQPIADKPETIRKNIGLDVVNMIENVLAKSNNLHIKTSDPYIAEFAEKYIAFLKEKGLEFNHSIEGPEKTTKNSDILDKAAEDFDKIKQDHSYEKSFESRDWVQECKKNSEIKSQTHSSPS